MSIYLCPFYLVKIVHLLAIRWMLDWLCDMNSSSLEQLEKLLGLLNKDDIYIDIYKVIHTHIYTLFFII